jgi:hypothetical protein
MKADIHLHSTASDGHFSPAELVSLAVNLGLEVISLTDHDTVDGIAPALAAAAEFPQLEVIPGIELSTDTPHNEVHILGYFIDYQDSELRERLSRLRHSREIRAQKMVAKLANLGIEIDWQRVQQLAGSGSFGRPHLAQAMLEKGYISSNKEAFLRYIGRDGPAYVEREKLTPSEAVAMIVKANGLPVLAHPREIDGLEALITQLQKEGLVGMEAYYNGYSPQTVRYLASIAHKYNLIACGGSDYHGLPGNTGETPIGGVNLPEESLRRLRALHQNQGLH